MIKDLSKSEQPRERLEKYGANNLSNAELLAILLKTGNTKYNVIELSNMILKSVGDISSFDDMTIRELTTFSGVGQVKAISLLAAIEFGKRVSSNNRDSHVIRNPISVYNLLKNDLINLKQEHFICLFLDTKSQLIKKQTLFIGGLNSSLIHPREIFKYAVKYSAAGLIVVHNHPSGDPKPSNNDIVITKQIYDIGEIMQIELYDHIIIGNSYYSLKENGDF